MKGTPFADVEFHFVDVTPELAQAWLGRNMKNRKLKDVTIAGFARDMKNGAWFTTHQGIAFNAAYELIDGQNRLHGIMQSGVTVRMLVSSGWPEKIPGQKGHTMDAVDMGCGRTVADQLELQHGMRNAKFVAATAGSLARLICGGLHAARKQSPSSVIAVVSIYKDEFNWLGENVTTTNGLRNIGVNGVVLLGLFAWPEATRKFYEQLKTGLGLQLTDPVYHLRNWLLTTYVGNSKNEVHKVRLSTAYHLKLFVEGKTSGSLVSNSEAGLLELRKLNAERVKKVFALFDVPEPKTVEKRVTTLPGNRQRRVKKICAIYNQISHDFTEQKKATQAENETKNDQAGPHSAAAIKIGNGFTGCFTLLDLTARCDGGSTQAGLFLAGWKARQWIETASFGQYRRTDKFPKAA